MKKVLLILVLVLGMASAAWATNFTLSGIDVDLNDSDPGLVLQSQQIPITPYSFVLNVGGSTTFDLFKIWTTESSLQGDDLVHKPINVSMDFSAPPPSFGSSLGGDTFGVKKLWGAVQYGQVLWDGPATFYFGPQGNGELLISLSNKSFNPGLFGLWGAEHLGANIEATVTYAKAAVPEPATMLLLGLGLLGVAGIRRFKK